MRILIIHTRYQQHGGEDASVDNQIAIQTAAGHDVLPMQFSNGGTAYGQVAALARSGWNRASANQAVATAARFQPDVVHVHNTWFAASQSVPVALTAAGHPTVCTLHNFRNICASGAFFRDGRTCTECLHGSLLKGVQHKCYRSSTVLSGVAALAIQRGQRGLRLQQGASRIAVLSQFALRLYAQAGFDVSRVSVTRNSVSDPGRRSLNAAQSNDLLFVGRDSPEKGLSFLLDAWAAYYGSSTKRFRLVLVGPDQSHSKPHVGVHAIGPASSDAVRARMLAARGLVFPTMCFENQPMVLLEALASGLPVLGSNLGSTPEVLGEAGWLARPGLVSDWVSGLRKFEDDTAVTLASDVARSTYEQNYTPHRQLEDLTALYAAARS